MQSSSEAAVVRVVTGHYGSGKTEFAVSLAMTRAQAGARVAVADLDIVNPYFRSRERAELMERSGIQVISSMLGHDAAIEIPAISPQVRAPLADPTVEVILDMGGDPIGAKILAQFRGDVIKRPYEVLLVVNAYRPETQDVDGVLRYLESIQSVAKLPVTGLVCNTHLLRETTSDDVRAGLDLCRRAATASGVPLTHVAAIPEALDGLDPSETEDLARQPIGMFLRETWM